MKSDHTPMPGPWALFLLLALALAGCGDDTGDASQSESGDVPDGGRLSPEELAAEPAPAVLADGPELEWDDLIPADWRPDKLFEEYDVGNIDDDDPRADALMDKLDTLWAEAPVVPELDGHSVKLPGFVVPLTTDAREIREFLLVPYFGACIHVPPPPPNQTVYVVTSEGGAYRGELFDTVWVEGVMHIETFDSDLGSAGYRIDAVRVSPYEEET
ncbi:DUF3299 domain-containing protein [uncultured Thiohalocapsa sp.]|uniref:DUF3299 domain-containing protein n=1 Tax=uncultured Thiohalocapsa sp. TaxID=768990 RepID=UPI0025DE9153|nr:DUF3299 domain-containing protein [uncultured Thiohalocapsa sp.]